MTQAISMGGNFIKTKKQLKDIAKANPEFIELIATSVFGNEYDGFLDKAPAGQYYVVGPDAWRDRKWYAQIIVTQSPFTVKVK